MNAGCAYAKIGVKNLKRQENFNICKDDDKIHRDTF